MKTETRQEKICPLCGQIYTEPSALSRTDNKTPICSDCSILQSLDNIGICEDEQLKILGIIHRAMQK